MGCPIKNSIAEIEAIYEMLEQLAGALPDRTVEVNDLLNNIEEAAAAIERNLGDV